MPDIMEAVVGRVHEYFSTRLTDPFPVYFAKGLYSEVSTRVYNAPDNLPLVWLVMNYKEEKGRRIGVFAEWKGDIVIATKTSKDYTQEQRDELTFKPRLIPIYDRLLYEMAKEPMFFVSQADRIRHTRTIRPYWGGGDVNGGGTNNLFKQQIDAISLDDMQITIRKPVCTT